MRAPEIDSELVEANPWWRDPNDWEEQDVELRAVRRSPFAYRPRPLEDLAPGGLYILRGPRRVGKSTALKQLVSERIRAGAPARQILHVSVEGRSAADVADIVRRGAAHWLRGEAGQRFWLLDEINAGLIVIRFFGRRTVSGTSRARGTRSSVAKGATAVLDRTISRSSAPERRRDAWDEPFGARADTPHP